MCTCGNGYKLDLWPQVSEHEELLFCHVASSFILVLASKRKESGWGFLLRVIVAAEKCVGSRGQ